MQNAFTIDYEDWYHSLGLPQENWDTYEDRIKVGHDKILNLLQKHKVSATFFLVGSIIDKHPKLIREIIEEGHEIGCHTYTHTAIYDMTPEQFSAELDKCNAALKTNTSSSFRGFRAPMWSIDESSWWALDIIKEHGYDYDSSIYPGDNKRTGIVGYRKDAHVLENGLKEIPCCTFPFLQFTVGVGGAYFRILPYSYTQRALKKLNNEGKNGMFYVHPWELDPDHPRVSGLSTRRRFPHYYNLARTEARIDRLLSDFEFAPLYQILQSQNVTA